MKPKVFISREIPAAGLDRITAACEVDMWEKDEKIPRDELLKRVQGVDGVLTMLTEKVNDELLDAAGEQLKVVSNYAVGYDNIDIPAVLKRGVKIGNTPGVLTDATADVAFVLLMAVARRVVEGANFVKDGQWKDWNPALMLGQDVTGATLGIVGLGRIGKAMAKRAHGFDMNVLAYGPRLTDEEAAEAGATRVEFDDLLAQSDYVSIHTPLNDNTRHLFNADVFAKMKSNAIVINTSRGPVIDQAALYDALKDGQIGGAGLDVTDPEPLPADSPLLDLKNVVVVPHIGSASVHTRNRMAEMSADNLIAGVNDEPLPTPVTG